VVIGWLLALSARSSAYLVPAMGVSLIAAGLVFGLHLLLILNVLLMILPFVAAFVFRRPVAYVGAEATARA
jgi:hypothetical protein